MYLGIKFAMLCIYKFNRDLLFDFKQTVDLKSTYLDAMKIEFNLVLRAMH